MVGEAAAVVGYQAMLLELELELEEDEALEDGCEDAEDEFPPEESPPPPPPQATSRRLSSRGKPSAARSDADMSVPFMGGDQAGSPRNSR